MGSIIPLHPSRTGPPPDGIDVIVEEATGCSTRSGRTLTLTCQNLGSIGLNADLYGALVWIYHDNTWHVGQVAEEYFSSSGNLDATFFYEQAWSLPVSVVIRPQGFAEQVKVGVEPSCQASSSRHPGLSASDLTLTT